MTRDLFIKQVEYEGWANMMVINAVENASEPLERTWEILSHLLIVPHSWLKRIEQEPALYQSWQRLDAGTLKKLAVDNIAAWYDYLQTKSDADLQEKVPFVFRGQNTSISVEDLLVHLVNHSSYHRGQVILQLKGKLDPLPLSTYIAFVTGLETG